MRIASRTGALLYMVSVIGAVAFTWPLFIRPESGLAHGSDAPLVFALVLPLLVAVVLVQVADGGLNANAVAMLGALSAFGAVLRPLGAGTAGVELVFFTIILGGRVFGPAFGFVLGSTTLFASALVTAGVGPWLPFQMLAASWIGMGAGLLPRWRGRPEIVALAMYGAATALLFGLAMNFSFWPFTAGPDSGISFVAGASAAENLSRFGAFHLATSMGWDIGRAVTNVVVIVAVGPGILSMLRRVARRSKFEELGTFAAHDPAISNR